MDTYIAHRIYYSQCINPRVSGLQCVRNQ